MGFWIFTAIVLAAFGFAVAFGRFEERVVLVVLLTNFVLTALLYRLGSTDWMQPQTSIFLLETVTLCILVLIAFRSKRYWPLPIAAFQMIPVLTFFVPLVSENLKSYGIGLTQGIWGYLQLTILIWASLRNKKRRMSESKTKA